ncbi:hypothetical protein FZEAL_744 [Fusarium zealandicum]|uniref:Prostacyclin synthase n=1 Tax=Fusarium zealandicum TaxID=1053134 RepID=A0A8H4XPF7_9HYPO|nr:hypothetical protein FZEAL_744 [Fusarium zealandicum]
MSKTTVTQSSSRLLCKASDDGPNSKDLQDLFSALIASLLPLEPHRVRFTKVEHTFLSEHAIHHLGNLKLTQSNRMPDPENPAGTVISTSTTTFSMNKNMAQSLCQRFVDARFIESGDGKKDQIFQQRGGVWRPTSKGTTIFDWFCERNRMYLEELHDLQCLITAPLLYLERDVRTDKPHVDRATIDFVFCRLIGIDGRGKKGPLALTRPDSVSGIRLTPERKVNGRVYQDTFTGQSISDWLRENTTCADMREMVHFASHFVHYNLIEPVTTDMAYMNQFAACKLFQPTPIAIYALSQRGQDLVESNSSSRCSSQGRTDSSSSKGGVAESNRHKLDKILAEPTLRLLFRENLKETFCEESLAFYEQASEFITDSKATLESVERGDKGSADSANELLSQSHIVFNTFLAPGSSREVNINHSLRISLSQRMTKAQSLDSTVADTLKEVTSLLESAQNAVFRLMASDSVPKFINNSAAEKQEYGLQEPQRDSREPPVLPSSIPIIGHMIGLLKHQGSYLKILYDSTSRQLATLPILGGKLYIILDPAIIQSAYRNKRLSFEPFAVEFAQRELLLSDKAFKIVKETSLVPEFFASIHPAMTGANLHLMTANALNYVSGQLGLIGDGGKALDIPNLYLWVRDLMTLATTEALYGPENPIRENPSLIKDLWDFEGGLSMLLLNVFPALTARTAHNARTRLQAALSKYYGANKDDHKDAAQIVKNRANVLRRHGIPDSEVGHFELALLHVATANTIPTLFWFIAQVFTRPELVLRLRSEVLPVAQRGADGHVTIDITTLDQKCPLLVSCYREAIRLSNQAVANRRVLEDTTVSDGKGNSYLLKKGLDVQMPAGVLHTMESVWGQDVHEFDAERFIDKNGKENSDLDKVKRSAFTPFGGGRHLCPGRNFAFAENVGLVACLLVGFDILPLQEGTAAFKVPTMVGCGFSEAAGKPENYGQGFGARIQKKIAAVWRATPLKSDSISLHPASPVE